MVQEGIEDTWKWRRRNRPNRQKLCPFFLLLYTNSKSQETQCLNNSCILVHTRHMEKVLISRNSVLFFIATIVLLLLVYYSRQVFLVSILGIGLGVLINPILTFLRRKLHLPRALSSILVLVAFIAIFSVVVWSMYYLLNDQISSLSSRWPTIKASTEGLVAKLFKQFPWLQEQVMNFDFTSYLKYSASGLVKGLSTSVMAISGLIFALVIGLYTAVNGKEYFDKTIEAFYPKYREKAVRVLEHSAQVIRAWFKAQLIDMVIIGVLTAVGLWIVGVEYWAIFGLLTGVLAIIPYVGIIIVVIIACLITLASDPSQIPWILLVFAVTQQLEGDVILPMVMKGGADLPVVPLLIFMLFLGTFFGILGVFMAPALLAVLRVVYIDVYLPIIERKRQREV